MNLAPKGIDTPFSDIKSRWPSSLEEAVEHVNSKFPFIADSVQSYEEFENKEGMVRATHITYCFGARIEGQNTVSELIVCWLLHMLDSAANSKRERLYWRLKPEITVRRHDFADGPAWVMEIFSRSAMV